MAIEPRRLTKSTKRIPRVRKPAVKGYTYNPIDARIEGLEFAYNFLTGPRAKNPGFADMRKACLNALIEGAQHPNDEVWPVAQELLTDLRKRGKLPKIKVKSESKQTIEEQKELKFLSKVDNPELLRENSNILNVVINFAKSGSTPIVRAKTIFLLGKTGLKSLIPILEKIKETDKNKNVKLVAGRSINMLRNRRK